MVQWHESPCYTVTKHLLNNLYTVEVTAKGQAEARRTCSWSSTLTLWSLFEQTHVETQQDLMVVVSKHGVTRKSVGLDYLLTPLEPPVRMYK